MEATEELLRRLSANDESCLREILSPRRQRDSLCPVTRSLVEISALLAVGAPTTSLRWSVERALTRVLQDAEVIQVLLSAASTVGVAQTVASAPRLALALDVDIEIDGWDGT